MLRRVSWKHGQQLYQLTLLTGNTHNKFRLLHQSNSTQCPSAIAQLRTISSEEPTNKTVPLTSVGDYQMDVEGDKAKFRPTPSLPTTVLDLAISALASNASLNVLALRVRSSKTLSELFLDRENVRHLAQDLAQSRFPQRSLKALTLSHHMGCIPKMNAYEGVAFRLAEAQEWVWLRRVSALAKKHAGRTTVRLLNWRLRSLIRTENFAKLDVTLSEFTREGLSPNRLTFHLLLTGYLCNHDLAKAKSVMQTMELAGFPIDATTTAAITAVYRSMGFHSDIEQSTVAHLDQLTSSVATTVLNSLIQLRLDAHDQRGALHLLSRFKHSHIHSLIQVISGDYSARVVGGGLHFLPNDITYALFIAQMAQTQDVHRAHLIIEAMLETNTPITATVIASLIHVYSANGDVSTPLRIVRAICDVPPSLWTPFVEDLNAAPPSITTVMVKPDIRVFNALLGAVLGCRGLCEAASVLHIMASAGISPNGATAHTILSHLDKREHASPRILARTLRQLLSNSNSRPSMQHMQIILRSFLRYEKFLLHGVGWDNKAAKFSRTRSLHGRRFAKPITALIDPFDPTAGLGVSSHSTELRPLLLPLRESLSSRSVRSTGATMALRIRRDAVNKGDLEGAREVVETLLARGVTPNEYHFSALMEGHAQLGDMHGAINVFQLAMRSGVKPNVVLYTILIAGFAQNGRPREALGSFRRLIKAGVKPDVPAIDAVSSAFFIVGSYGMARRVLLSLWSLVGPPPTDADTTPLKQLAKTFRSLHKENRGKEEREITSEEQQALDARIQNLLQAWSSHRPGAKR